MTLGRPGRKGERCLRKLVTYWFEQARTYHRIVSTQAELIARAEVAARCREGRLEAEDAARVFRVALEGRHGERLPKIAERLSKVEMDLRDLPGDVRTALGAFLTGSGSSSDRDQALVAMIENGNITELAAHKAKLDSLLNRLANLSVALDNVAAVWWRPSRGTAIPRTRSQGRRHFGPGDREIHRQESSLAGNP
jgi:hypothetical protein